MHLPNSFKESYCPGLQLPQEAEVVVMLVEKLKTHHRFGVQIRLWTTALPRTIDCFQRDVRIDVHRKCCTGRFRCARPQRVAKTSSEGGDRNNFRHGHFSLRDELLRIRTEKKALFGKWRKSRWKEGEETIA